MKLDILGTEYTFTETTPHADQRLFDTDGYVDRYTKTIAVDTDYNENHPSAIGDFPTRLKKVKRHEIIHAFFCESGMSEWCSNEQLVDWLAWQFPKLLEAFKKTDCI